MAKYIDDTCVVTCEDNGRTVTADILDFKEEKTLHVSLNKTLKLVMLWNGRIYEGNQSGLTFVSKGPKIVETKDGR